MYMFSDTNLPREWRRVNTDYGWSIKITCLWKYSLAMNLYHIYQSPVWLHAAGNLTCQQSFSSEHRGCPQKLPEPSTKIHLSKELEERCQGHYRNFSLSSFGAGQIYLFTFPAQVEIPMSLIFNQLYFPISHSWHLHIFLGKLQNLLGQESPLCRWQKSSWPLYRTHEGGNQSVDKHLLTTIQVLSSKTMIWKFKGSQVG